MESQPIIVETSEKRTEFKNTILHLLQAANEEKVPYAPFVPQSSDPPIEINQEIKHLKRKASGKSGENSLFPLKKRLNFSSSKRSGEENGEGNDSDVSDNDVAKAIQVLESSQRASSVSPIPFLEQRPSTPTTPPVLQLPPSRPQILEASPRKKKIEAI